MKITPIEIKEHRFKKGLLGYDKNEVNAQDNRLKFIKK